MLDYSGVVTFDPADFLEFEIDSGGRLLRIPPTETPSELTSW